MQLFTMLRHLSGLLALSTLCRAWRANFSDAIQCGTVTVTWSATATESIGPPFVIRMAAFGLAPLIFNLPSSSWSAASRAGSYSFTVPWPEGTQFLSVMDDGFGTGTGGISGIQTVKSSSNSTCINSSITEPSHIFDIYSSFVQCSQVSLNWTEPATSQTLITGLVPSGVTFQLDRPLTGSKSTTWDLNIEAGTAFILIYNDGAGNGMTSPLLESLGGSNTQCLASGAYPSATASQTRATQGTVTGTPVPSSTASSISNSEPSNSRSNLGPILGAVFGVLALLGALGVWIALRRRRRKWVVPQLTKEVDLDVRNAHSKPQFDRGHSSTSPHPEGAVILPFILPYSDSHQQENTPLNPPRKRPIRDILGDTADTSDSSQVYMAGTSASQSTPGFRSDTDDEPMFIRHEDAGAVFPHRTREVIELPPGYHELPRRLPPTPTHQQEGPRPTPPQKLTGE